MLIYIFILFFLFAVFAYVSRRVYLLLYFPYQLIRVHISANAYVCVVGHFRNIISYAQVPLVTFRNVIFSVTSARAFLE